MIKYVIYNLLFFIAGFIICYFLQKNKYKKLLMENLNYTERTVIKKLISRKNFKL